MIGLGFGIKFIGTVIELLLPWILAIILNRYAPAGDWDMTRRLGLLMLLCSGLALAANVTANRLATKLPEILFTGCGRICSTRY